MNELTQVIQESLTKALNDNGRSMAETTVFVISTSISASVLEHINDRYIEKNEIEGNPITVEEFDDEQVQDSDDEAAEWWEAVEAHEESLDDHEGRLQALEEAVAKLSRTKRIKLVNRKSSESSVQLPGEEAVIVPAPILLGTTFEIHDGAKSLLEQSEYDRSVKDKLESLPDVQISLSGYRV